MRTLGAQIVIILLVGVAPVIVAGLLYFFKKIITGSGSLERFTILGYILAPWLFLITVPAIEECFFRAILILFFHSFSLIALICMVINSLIFGLLHTTTAEMDIVKTFLGITPTGGYKTQKFVSTAVLGLILSYQAILYQSLYRCFWIHTIWNAVVLGIIILLVKFHIPIFRAFSAIRTRLGR